MHADDRRRAGSEVEVGAAVLQHQLEQVVDVQLVGAVVADGIGADLDAHRRRGGHRAAGEVCAVVRAVDHVDGPLELDTVGDGGDDLVAGRGADRRDRVVVRRFRERDDELALFEVTGERDVLARQLGGDQRRRILVDRRLQKVDEANAHVLPRARR